MIPFVSDLDFWGVNLLQLVLTVISSLLAHVRAPGHGGSEM